MSFTYSYQSTMTQGARVYDQRIKNVGTIQSVTYYDPTSYYSRLFGSWPNRNFDTINVLYDGEGAETIYKGESCANLELESASAGSNYINNKLWYKFEETVGTTSGDWISNVPGIGAPVGGAPLTTSAGKVGSRCLLLNGTTQYVYGGVTNQPIDGAVSFSFWIKTTDTTGTIVGFGGGIVNNCERVVRLNAGKVQIFEKNGAGETVYSSTGTVNDNNWNQIVCTIAANDGAWNIFVNKVDVGDGSQNGPGTSNLTVTKTVIGASWLNGTISNYFGGRIDDFRIFSNVLTTNQIKELYDLAN